MFARVGRVLIGSVVTSRGQHYRLRYAGAGVHVFEEVNPRLFPDEATSRYVARSTVSAPDDPLVCTTDEGIQIDVLVAYTAAALLGAQGADAMEASIHLMIGATNQSYINSGIAQRIRLVHVEQVAHDESGDVKTDLAVLLTPTPDPASISNELEALRNSVGADCVLMIVEKAVGRCGDSIPMRLVSTNHAPYAFAVVGRECALQKFSFAHELGHLMAAAHDWAAADCTPTSPCAFEYAHGFTHTGTTAGPDEASTEPPPPSTPAWRTMMSLGRECTDPDQDCPRLLFWSNPDPEFSRDGIRMGVAVGQPEAADNRLTLNNSAATVARFRCGQPSREDAWMKDAWSDSGMEPEPGLVGKPMWKSPSIWVRRAADPDRVHAHDHENPRQGATNYAYVKIHGGTVGITGNLRLYAARASSGLAWPDDWTPIGLVTLAPLEAYDTRIIEFPWTPQESGHFCLVARWVAVEDPMAVPESPRIEANVRANNNLVWRNVNVVDLTSPSSNSAVFYLANPGKEPATYTLSIVSSGASLGKVFLGHGGVRLRTDARFRGAWVGEPMIGHVSFGSGHVRQGKEMLISSDADGMIIRGLIMPARTKIPVYLEFARNAVRSVPGASFELDITQIETSPRRPSVVGGVSYEVRR